MKLKALVLIVGAGVLAAVGLFAAAVATPSRADGPALREALFSRLGEWLGGEVVRRGPVRLEGVFNMTLEAENVEIKGAKRLDAALRFKVGKLSARLNWFDAVMGRPHFNELTLENVTAEAEAPIAPEGGALILAGSSGVGDFAPLFDAGRLSAEGKTNPFTRLQISDARVVFTSRSASSGRRRAHPRLKIVNMLIKFGADGGQELAGNVIWRNQAFALTAQRGTPGEKLAGASLDLSIDGNLFTLTAAGELTSGTEREPQFRGEVNVASSDFGAATRWLKIGLPRKLQLDGEALSVSGRVTWKKHELSVSRLEAGLNDRSLSGALSIRDRAAGRLGIEGTLAFSDFDLGALGGAAWEGDSAGAAPWPPGLLQAADADLRMSVKRLSAGGVSGGSAALTLLAKDGRLSADLADMKVLGGRVRGHFALDASRPQRRLVVRATGADLDSDQLSRAFDMPGWLTGGANVNLEAQADGGDWPSLLRSLNGEADVSFSEGGSVGLDLVGLAGANGKAHRAAQHGSRWNWAGQGFMQFETLRAQLSIDHGRIRSKSFELSAGGNAVAGRCIVDLPGQSIDWRFDVRPAAALGMDAAPDGAANPLAAGELASSVTIKGPWRNPSIRVGEPGAELEWPTGARTHLPGPAPNG